MKIEEKRKEITKMLNNAVKEWKNSEFAKKYETDYESATFHDKEDSDSYLEVYCDYLVARNSGNIISLMFKGPWRTSEVKKYAACLKKEHLHTIAVDLENPEFLNKVFILEKEGFYPATIQSMKNEKKKWVNVLLLHWEE